MKKLFFMASILILLPYLSNYAQKKYFANNANLWIFSQDKSGSMVKEYPLERTHYLQKLLIKNKILTVIKDSLNLKINFENDFFLFFDTGILEAPLIDLSLIESFPPFENSFIHFYGTPSIKKFNNNNELIEYLLMQTETSYNYNQSFVSLIRLFALIKALNYLKDNNINTKHFNHIYICSITDDADQNDQWATDYRRLKKYAPKQLKDVNQKLNKYETNSFNKYSRNIGYFDELYYNSSVQPRLIIHQYLTQQKISSIFNKNLLSVSYDKGEYCILPLNIEYNKGDSLVAFEIDSMTINDTRHPISALQPTNRVSFYIPNSSIFSSNKIVIDGKYLITYIDSILGPRLKPVQFNNVIFFYSNTQIIILYFILFIIFILFIYFIHNYYYRTMFIIMGADNSCYHLCNGIKLNKDYTSNIPLQILRYIYCCGSFKKQVTISKYFKRLSKTSIVLNKPLNTFLIMSKYKIVFDNYDSRVFNILRSGTHSLFNYKTKDGFFTNYPFRLLSPSFHYYLVKISINSNKNTSAELAYSINKTNFTLAVDNILEEKEISNEVPTDDKVIINLINSSEEKQTKNKYLQLLRFENDDLLWSVYELEFRNELSTIKKYYHFKILNYHLLFLPKILIKFLISHHSIVREFKQYFIKKNKKISAIFQFPYHYFNEKAFIINKLLSNKYDNDFMYCITNNILVPSSNQQSIYKSNLTFDEIKNYFLIKNENDQYILTDQFRISFSSFLQSKKIQNSCGREFKNKLRDCTKSLQKSIHKKLSSIIYLVDNSKYLPIKNYLEKNKTSIISSDKDFFNIIIKKSDFPCFLKLTKAQNENPFTEKYLPIYTPFEFNNSLSRDLKLPSGDYFLYSCFYIHQKKFNKISNNKFVDSLLKNRISRFFHKYWFFSNKYLYNILNKKISDDILKVSYKFEQTQQLVFDNNKIKLYNISFIDYSNLW